MAPTDSCQDYSEYGIKYNSFLAISKQALLKGEETVQYWKYVTYELRTELLFLLLFHIWHKLLVYQHMVDK